MRQFGMVGTTYRRAGQAELQRYTVAAADAAGALPALHAACGVSESVYLATCNRVELVFARPDGLSTAAVRQRMHAHFHAAARAWPAPAQAAAAAQAFHAYDGEGAAEHLFMVAASLDSMRPGEAQILGQVKDAFRAAQALRLAGPQLGLLFEETFQAAKRVRHVTRLGEGTVSLLSLALAHIEARLGAAGGTAVVVGAGEMARQCGQAFAAMPNVACIFVNRTLAGAATLAAQHGGRALALAEFCAAPPPCDVLVTATSADTAFIDAALLARLPGAAPLCVDLSVQRNVVPAAAQARGAVLLDLDALRHTAEQHQAARAGELAGARLLLDEALAAFRRRLVERELAPVVRALRAMYQAAMDHEIEALCSAGEWDAAPARARLTRWAAGVVNRMAHVPIVGLKHLAVVHGPEAVEAFVDGVARDVRPPAAKARG